MNNRGYISFFLVIILVVLIIFLGIGWYFYKTSGKTNSSNQTIESDNKKIAWKTYQNEKDRYTIDYPSDITLGTDAVGDPVFKFPKGNEYELVEIISIGVADLPDNLSIPEAITQGESPMGSYSTEDIEFKEVMIGDYLGLANEGIGRGHSYDAHFIKNGKIYGFRLSEGDNPKDAMQHKSQKEIFDQMIKTFKLF